MHRRKFLATLGATAIAGCTAQTAPTEDQSTTVPPTEQPTTSRPTTERTTERTAERPTDEPESTPTFGEELLDRGRTHLEAAIEAFVESGAGEDPTIVDVSAATTEFSRHDVGNEYRAAKEDLLRAKEYTEGSQADTVDDLLEIAEFVDALGFAQIQLVNSFERVNTAVRTLYTESYGELEDDVDDIGYHRNLAAQHATSLRDTFDASTFEAVEFLTGAQFEAKVAQIDRELATFDGLVTHLDGIAAAMEAFEADVAKYTTRNYDGVVFAASEFEEARDGLAAIEPAESLGAIVEELTCVFEALAGGTDVMQRAVLSRQNGDNSTASEYEADAEAEFQSCETLVEEVEPVERLVGSI